MAVERRTSDDVLLSTALENFYNAAEDGIEDDLIEILSRSEEGFAYPYPLRWTMVLLRFLTDIA